jgi:hypothetical protein
LEEKRSSALTKKNKEEEKKILILVIKEVTVQIFMFGVVFPAKCKKKKMRVVDKMNQFFFSFCFATRHSCRLGFFPVALVLQ